jgi:hypothetical protein
MILIGVFKKMKNLITIVSTAVLIFVALLVSLILLKTKGFDEHVSVIEIINTITKEFPSYLLIYLASVYLFFLRFRKEEGKVVEKSTLKTFYIKRNGNVIVTDEELSHDQLRKIKENFDSMVTRFEKQLKEAGKNGMQDNSENNFPYFIGQIKSVQDNSEKNSS